MLNPTGPANVSSPSFSKKIRVCVPLYLLRAGLSKLYAQEQNSIQDNVVKLGAAQLKRGCTEFSSCQVRVALKPPSWQQRAALAHCLCSCFLFISLIGKSPFKCFHSLQSINDENPTRTVLNVEPQKDLFPGSPYVLGKGSCISQGKIKDLKQHLKIYSRVSQQILIADC